MGRPRKQKIEEVEVQEDSGVLVVTNQQLDGGPPLMESLEWNDYVLSQFSDGEKDPEGRPTVDGLRRVATNLLGPIVSSVPRTVVAPTPQNDNHATVEYAITFAFGGDRTDLRTYGDVADVYVGNTSPEYAVFASATASTRAEGRALRKALLLRKVVTAEEVNAGVPLGTSLPGMITSEQIRAIDKMCRDLDINVKTWINLDMPRNDITEVSYDKAVQMSTGLNKLLQDPDSIKSKWKGYDPNWRTR